MPPSDPSDPSERILWTWAILSLIALLSLSLGPAPPGLQAFPGADKVWHTISYAAVTFLWLLAGVWRPVRGEGRYPLTMLAIVIGFAMLGALLEVIQQWVDRSADPLDWLADLLGVAIAVGSWTVIRQQWEDDPHDQ